MRSGVGAALLPVAALALPELRTTAAARPSARWPRLICTGAAATRLLVNTPAAVTGAPSAVATMREVGRARLLDARRERRRPRTRART